MSNSILWPSMPSGWAALKVFNVTSLNAFCVVVPTAASGPLSGTDMPSLMVAPAGIGGYFDATVVDTPELVPLVFFDELPHAATASVPAVAMARTALTAEGLRIDPPLGLCVV